MTSAPLTGSYLVSGAAGDIGESTARRLHAAGARLLLIDRLHDPIQALALDLDPTGSDVVAIACDQSDPTDVANMAAKAAGRFSDLAGAFVNAGIGRYGALLDLSAADWQRQVDVNLTGSFLIAQSAARMIVTGGRGGSIVFNASTAAACPTALFGAYGSSKAGLRLLSRTMALEWGHLGIRSNVIMPGVIATRMTSGLLADPQINADVVAETPIGRLGRPNDIAGLVAFLLGPDSSFITGAEILIDGGQTLAGYPRWFSRSPSDAPQNWSLHAKRA